MFNLQRSSRSVALLAGAMLFAAPYVAFAQTSSPSSQPTMTPSTPTAPLPPTSPTTPMTPTAPQAAHHGDPLEARITELHDKLQITKGQEKEWHLLAKVMHENAAKSRDLVHQKREKEATMTAVEDLRAYAAVAEEHAQGVKRLAVAFEGLYKVMTVDQKHVADDYFRQHKRDANAERDAS